MIVYDGGYWHVSFIWQLTGSVFPKALVWSVPTAIAAAVLNKWVVNKVENTLGVSQVWAAYNFTLGFLIVFRTQQAYTRFWEGSTLLQQVRAEWFNAVSSCFAFCSLKEEKKPEVKKFQHLLVRLASLLYCTSLQAIAVLSDESFEVLDMDGISASHLDYLASASDKSLVVLQWIQRLIVQAQEDGVIIAAPPILSRVYQELSRGIVNAFNAQKITDIIFPFPYAQMVTVLLLLSTIVTPGVTAVLMETPFWAAFLTFLTVSVYWCVNYIAAEIEMPFGEDPNDLPIASYQEIFNTNLRMLLDEHSQRPPEYNFNPKGRHTMLAQGFSCPFELITSLDHNIWNNGNHLVRKAEERNKRKSKMSRETRSLVSFAEDPDEEESITPQQQTELLRARASRVRASARFPSVGTAIGSSSSSDHDLNLKALFESSYSVVFVSDDRPYAATKSISAKSVRIAADPPVDSVDQNNSICNNQKHISNIGLLELGESVQRLGDCMQKINESWDNHIACTILELQRLQHSRNSERFKHLYELLSVPLEFNRVGIELGTPPLSPRADCKEMPPHPSTPQVSPRTDEEGRSKTALPTVPSGGSKELRSHNFES